MKLDHLESFVRSGQAHGRTVTAPPVLLSRIRLAEGTVDTDADTGAELAELVAGEARSQRSAANVLPVAVRAKPSNSSSKRPTGSQLYA